MIQYCLDNCSRPRNEPYYEELEPMRMKATEEIVLCIVSTYLLTVDAIFKKQN